MSSPRSYPISLVAPESASAGERRARRGVVTDDLEDPIALDDTEGVDTLGARWLHITVDLPDDDTSCDWELWLYDRVADKWRLCVDLGTVQAVAGAADNPQGRMVEIGRAARAYVKIDNMSGFTSSSSGVDVWLSGVQD